MSYGLRVRDANGVITVNVATRLTKILGSIETGTNNGSFVIPSGAGGSPFYMMAGATGFRAGVHYPTITLSGWTLSWQFHFGLSMYWNSVTIVYGVHV